jgi:hypothetical protein
MGPGRLIRVSKFPGDQEAKAYLVAVADKQEAVDLITAKAANTGDHIEDLGRVSDTLLAAMALAPGHFVPISGTARLGQQQPPLQAKPKP